MTGSSGWQGDRRLGGLRRFAFAITLLNVLGHTWFGFEQPWVVPFVALGAAYLTELCLDTIDALASDRPVRYGKTVGGTVDFLLSAHISGLAVGMLLYSNERLWPVVFAAVVAVASKSLYRVSFGRASRHVMNPSNFGIAVTLLAFPWVGIAPPYHFTENLGSIGDWVLPAIIVISGTFLNFRFTHRLPLIAAWLAGFVGQAFVRSLFSNGPVLEAFAPALVPMTGLAFVLYTFYMVTDPATTPESPRAQVAFGGGVAVVYGLLVSAHVVFGLFFALSTVSAIRGIACALAPRIAQQPMRPVTGAAVSAVVERV